MAKLICEPASDNKCRNAGIVGNLRCLFWFSGPTVAFTHKLSFITYSLSFICVGALIKKLIKRRRRYRSMSVSYCALDAVQLQYMHPRTIDVAMGVRSLLLQGSISKDG